LSESHYKHQLEADIRPFRDLLLGLFFISVGAQLALPALIENWLLILGCSLGLILMKTAIVFAAATPWHKDSADKLKAGLCLGQGGEFGFALLALAFSHELTSPQMNAILVATIIVTMILTPIMMGQGHQLINRWLCNSKTQETVHEPLSLEALKETGEGLDDHVIVCGYGRVGQVIARFLPPINYPYVVMDSDPIRVKEAELAGEHIVYGDCRNPDMLRLLGAERAKLLILTFPEYDITLEATKAITREFPNLQVLVRTTDDSGLEELQALGVTEVIPETLEASLTLVSHALALIGVPHDEVEIQINEVRAARYELLHGFYHGIHSSKTDEDGNMAELRHAFTVSAECFASGKTLGDLNIEGYGTEVETVRRNKDSFYHPPSDFELNAGDIIVLRGNGDKVSCAEEFLSTGQT
ncbi:MAG: NAD-binding protein, partial [Pontibacterium sp.]